MGAGFAKTGGRQICKVGQCCGAGLGRGLRVGYGVVEAVVEAIVGTTLVGNDRWAGFDDNRTVLVALRCQSGQCCAALCIAAAPGARANKEYCSARPVRGSADQSASTSRTGGTIRDELI
jgi:hypothetical protein